MIKKSPANQSTITTSGPTAPVPKDPQPSVDRIDELARRILKGDILLPKFQRDFVWDRDQVRLLLDSVSRGYPIGSVLLWQSRQELRSQNRIGDLNIELPKPDYPVNYLLDGQQRLSTICGAMFWKGDDERSPWNIAYDLRVQEFLHLETLEDPPLHQIRINRLSDPAAYFKHVASIDTLSAPDKDELKMRADTLFNRFKDYKIATVTLGDMSIKDVAPIFERINSTGTSLTIVDLMRAATWSPDFDLIDSITLILDELADKGFENIDKKVILRNISAASGGGFSADSIDSLRNHTVEKLKSAVENTKEAYKKLVDFLNTNIGLPSDNIIPYSNQLTVLGEIFRQIQIPSADQYREISKWFWKTSLTGYFSGWNTGNMAQDLASVTAFAQGKASKIAFAADVMPHADMWKTKQFRLNNAHAKLLAIILANHRPIDLLTGQFIDTSEALSWSNTKEFHHVFPKEFLKEFLKGKDTPRERINCLANIVMLTSASNKIFRMRAPSDYFKDVEKAAGSQLETWLSSNLISKEAYEAALRDDFDLFLNYRANQIHEAVIAKTDWQI